MKVDLTAAQRRVIVIALQHYLTAMLDNDQNNPQEAADIRTITNLLTKL